MTDTIQIITTNDVTTIQPSSTDSVIETSVTQVRIETDLVQTVINSVVSATNVVHEASVVIFGGGGSSNSFMPSGW